MRDIRTYGRQIQTQCELIADKCYQREDVTDEMLAIVLKQIVLYTELIVQSANNFNDFDNQINTWQESFANLAKSVQDKDNILSADYLHYEISKEIDEWIASMKK